METGVLERRAKKSMKGTIPVISLPTLSGVGWEQLKDSRYEVYDTVVRGGDINLEPDGRVVIPDGEFWLTPYAATGFAYCSETDDRSCETEDAAKLISQGFHRRPDKEWLIRITDGGSITTIVTPRYIPLTNRRVIDDLVKMEKEMDQDSYWKMSPWELKIAIQSKKPLKIAGEEWHAGSLIENGEHGKRAFQAMGRMVQQICMNGAVLQFGEAVDIYKKHNGGDSWEEFDVLGAVREIVNKAIAGNGFFEHLEKMPLKNLKMKEDTFKNITARGQLGPRQAEALPISYYMQRQLRPHRKSETMYDIYNAVTGMKDNFPKSRFQWEDLAGRLLLGPEGFYPN